jgi:hypothetical protein
MKAQDFVSEVEKTFVGSKFKIDDETRINIKEYLFDMLVSDMGNILATRVNKVFKDDLSNKSASTLMVEIGKNCIGAYRDSLGSILNDINLKAEKINSLGKYGFPNEWFRHMFAEKVQNYTKQNPETSWRYFLPECKDIGTVEAFIKIRDFLSP